MGALTCRQVLPNGARCKNSTKRGETYCWLPEHDGRSPARTNGDTSSPTAGLEGVDLAQEETSPLVDDTLNAFADALSDTRPPDERGYVHHPDNHHLHEMQLGVHACADLLRRLEAADSVWWDMHLQLSDDLDEFVRVRKLTQEAMWAAVRDAGLFREGAKTPFEAAHLAMHERIVDLGAEARRCDSRLRDMSAAALHAGDPDEDPVFVDARKRRESMESRLTQIRQELDAAREELDAAQFHMDETRAAGLDHMHGVRHAYALDRYEDLTGWKAPAAGGPARHTLTAEKVRLDTAARLTIAAELGHSRLEIARQYCGS